MVSGRRSNFTGINNNYVFPGKNQKPAKPQQFPAEKGQ
jgi:hypothetical protein